MRTSKRCLNILGGGGLAGVAVTIISSSSTTSSIACKSTNLRQAQLQGMLLD